MEHDPEQVFYKLNELSEMLGVETSVLRFWEKEFPQIKPLKVSPRKRLYRRRDLEIFQEIKRLLYEERFTIAGAKKRLNPEGFRQGRLFEDGDKLGDALPGAPREDWPLLASGAPPEPEQLRAARSLLEATRRDLLLIKEILAKPPGRVSPSPPPATRPRARPKKKPPPTQDLPHDPLDPAT
ncbi:MAG: MerR family transcriptional regulator [Candidatus Adiutrix sp.]|jgi:DNA-binding transcriptional MerR regulator|nr:MerR family transcriptional regulator [Candidatus Adiutrix sp.]